MIPTYLLKLLAHQLVPALALLYQASLDQGQLPEDWKTADVLPILRRATYVSPPIIGQYHLPACSVCCKVMEHIVYSNILHHL